MVFKGVFLLLIVIGSRVHFLAFNGNSWSLSQHEHLCCGQYQLILRMNLSVSKVLENPLCCLVIVAMACATLNSPMFRICFLLA